MRLQLIINIIVTGIAFFSGLNHFKRLDKSFITIVFFTGIAFVTEVTLTALIVSGVKTTMPGLHFYIMVEFLLWTLFYKDLLHPYIHKNVLTACILIFETYAVINVAFIQDLFTMPHLVRAVEGLILVIFSVLLFGKIMVEAKYRKL